MNVRSKKALAYARIFSVWYVMLLVQQLIRGHTPDFAWDVPMAGAAAVVLPWALRYTGCLDPPGPDIDRTPGVELPEDFEERCAAFHAWLMKDAPSQRTL